METVFPFDLPTMLQDVLRQLQNLEHVVRSGKDEREVCFLDKLCGIGSKWLCLFLSQ